MADQYNITNGHQLQTSYTKKSYVLVSGENGTDQDIVLQNQNAIPNTGDFESGVVHLASEDASTGRFSDSPSGTVCYCNEKESFIWGGEEIRCAAFYTMTSWTFSGGPVELLEHTIPMNNDLQTSGNIITIGGGNDADTNLLMHFNGTDGSTTFTDETGTHTPTNGGTGAKISTDVFKFGSASGFFDGVNDIVTVPDSAEWNKGTSRFTEEGWIYIETMPTGTDMAGIFEQYIDPSNHAYLRFGATEIEFSIDGVSFSGTHNFMTGQFYHWAIIRGWGDNDNDFAITINGEAVATKTSWAVTWADYAAALVFGRSSDTNGIFFNGYMDEIRGSDGSRWTQDFVPAVKQYEDAQLQMVLLSVRPLDGIKYYVMDGNLTTAALTCDVWTGQDFLALDVTDNTTGLATTGTLTFNSTESVAKPMHFEGIHLYAYRVTLSAGEATIYHVTLSAPFQALKNVWDGVFRQAISFQYYDTSATKFNDYTLEVNQGSTSSVPIGAEIGQAAANDYIELIFQERISAIRFAMIADKVNILASVISLQYWSGIALTDLTAISDGTSDGTGTLSKTGLVSWNPPLETEEAQITKYGVSGYLYRISFSSVLTGAAIDDVIIDTILAVPVTKKVVPFRFSAQYKNKLLLCGNIAGKEGSRIDFCLDNAPDVWNGTESSQAGLQSIYTGGNEELTCGTQLYNRFGAGVFATFLALKNNETYLINGTGADDYETFPISFSIGCPAPLTLASIESGYLVGEAVIRNIAMWVSFNGPIIFDGAAIIPVPGVENFFDPAEDDYINVECLPGSRGWYDSINNEYNMIIPTGTSVVNNTWLAYDLSKKKWLEKDPALMPLCGFNVKDLNGKKYTYGGIDGGLMVELENGNTWNGTPITWVVESGDFYPADDIWVQTRITHFKNVAIREDTTVNIFISHYADTAESKPSVTRSDISFDAATGVIETTSGNFKDFGVCANNRITLSGSASNNSTFTVDGVNKTQINVSEALVDEIAGSSVTITIESIITHDSSSGTGRLSRKNQEMDHEAWSHRILLTAGTSIGGELFGYGYQYDITKDDRVESGQ